MNLISKIFSLFFVILFFAGCETTKPTVNVHGEKPLIDTSKVVSEGKKQIDKKVKDGPKPIENTNNTKTKRKTITTQNVKNYVSIPEDFTNLKQKISINFQGLDFSYVMSLMAELGNINILVGDEVSGTVTAKIDDVSWDTAFQTILDMKTLVADINAVDGIIRVHTPEKLTEQETAKSARAEVLKKKIELEESVEPILAEIFRLYYISPAQAKTTLEDLFASQGEEGAAVMNNLKITVEGTTRSIIVRGKEKDLDIVDKVIREIDKRTKQVLIEAFIVEASSTFEQNLGKRLGFAYTRNRERVGGTQGGSSIGNAGGGQASIGDSTGGFTSGAGTDNLINLGSAASTAGIGILRRTGSAVLKLELDALENEGLSKTVSNPKLFTLDNQQASINQGETIYIDGGDGEDKPVDASLKLIVTPNIIGDGNVMLQIQVNNDTPNRANPGSPGVNKMEINTKLLVADGDIVVIGGIKKNNVANSKGGVPGVSKLPVVGKALSGTSKSDTMNELLVFIAPRIL